MVNSGMISIHIEKKKHIDGLHGLRLHRWFFQTRLSTVSMAYFCVFVYIYIIQYV